MIVFHPKGEAEASLLRLYMFSLLLFSTFKTKSTIVLFYIALCKKNTHGQASPCIPDLILI